MKWIEIIELRSAGNSPKQLQMQLQEFMKQVEKTEEPNVKFYTRMTIDTDISIHLIHDSKRVKNTGSSLGTRLVSALKSLGLLSHTIWIEKQNNSFT